MRMQFTQMRWHLSLICVLFLLRLKWPKSKNFYELNYCLSSILTCYLAYCTSSHKTKTKQNSEKMISNLPRTTKGTFGKTGSRDVLAAMLVDHHKAHFYALGMELYFYANL